MRRWVLHRYSRLIELALSLVLKAELNEQLSEQEREQTKAQCYMKCPKCGADLNEVIFRGIKIDRCLLCDGVWLDEGELEKLAGTENESVIGNIIQIISGKA